MNINYSINQFKKNDTVYHAYIQGITRGTWASVLRILFIYLFLLHLHLFLLHLQHCSRAKWITKARFKQLCFTTVWCNNNKQKISRKKNNEKKKKKQIFVRSAQPVIRLSVVWGDIELKCPDRTRMNQQRKSLFPIVPCARSHFCFLIRSLTRGG